MDSFPPTVDGSPMIPTGPAGLRSTHNVFRARVACDRSLPSGGGQPRWRRDGKELYYVDLNGRLLAIPIDLPASKDSLDAGPATVLFATRIWGGGTPLINDKQQYAVSPDGKRFLINVPPQEPPPPIVVILNWKPGSGK